MAMKLRVSAEPTIEGTIAKPLPTPMSVRNRRRRLVRVGIGEEPSGSRGSIGSSIP